MMRRLCLLLLAACMQVATYAKRSRASGEKFVGMYVHDTTLKCVTVSPKMMEMMVKTFSENRPENVTQAIAKLKSARIVTGRAEYYQKAEELLNKNRRRFKAEKEYRNDEQHGAFFTRKNRKGKTVEFIMLHEEFEHDQFTIINLTGDIDEEFLCFLYNKSF